MKDFLIVSALFVGVGALVYKLMGGWSAGGGDSGGDWSSSDSDGGGGDGGGSD